MAGLLLPPASRKRTFSPGTPFPRFRRRTFSGIRGPERDSDRESDLVILFFFTPENGKPIAAKLQALKRLYPGMISIIALGMESDKAALQQFADSLKIQYFLLADEAVKSAAWYKDVSQLPLTLFVHTPQRTIERVLRGTSSEQANILKEVAENLFQQRKTDKAAAVATTALENGEDAAALKELNGHILVAEGKLDDAEKEFGAIGSDAGIAKVALERGDLTGAIAAADRAATTVRAGGEGRGADEGWRTDDAAAA